jgi:hypothetical protein
VAPFASWWLELDQSGASIHLAGKVLTWPGQRYGNASAHRIVADTSDNGNAPFARFKQGFYDVTSDSDQYIGPISHESGG